MQASSRSTTGLGRIAVILACAVSGGAHVGLVPAHLEHDPELGAAFILAALATLAAAVGLTLHAGAASVRAAAGVLAALLGAYALSVTTGIPVLVDEPEAVDGVGLATKAIEAVGLACALQLNTTLGERGSLIRTEARP